MFDGENNLWNHLIRQWSGLETITLTFSDAFAQSLKDYMIAIFRFAYNIAIAAEGTAAPPLVVKAYTPNLTPPTTSSMFIPHASTVEAVRQKYHQRIQLPRATTIELIGPTCHANVGTLQRYTKNGYRFRASPTVNGLVPEPGDWFRLEWVKDGDPE